MTFQEWWENESGWGGHLLAEGRLAKDVWDYQQAIIDRLMLEHCPEEMTEVQVKEFIENQQSVIDKPLCGHDSWEGQCEECIPF